MGKYTSIKEVSVTFLQDQDRYIFLPKLVRVSASPNGQDFITIEEFNIGGAHKDNQVASEEFKAKPDVSINARYVHVIAENIGVCPKWHPGAGDKAWIFTDEIEVK